MQTAETRPDGYVPSRPLTPRLRPVTTATDLTSTLADPWAGWLPGMTPPPFDIPTPQPLPAGPSRPFPAQLYTQSGRLTPIPRGVLRTSRHDTPIIWLPGYSPGIERADSAHPLLWPDEPAPVTVRLPESEAQADGADWRLVRVVGFFAFVVAVALVAGIMAHVGGL